MLMACVGAECKGGEEGGDGCAYDVCVVVLVRRVCVCVCLVFNCVALVGRLRRGLGRASRVCFWGFGNRCVACGGAV